MKLFIVFAALAISMNSFAYEESSTWGITDATGASTEGTMIYKEAKNSLQNIESYRLSGAMSPSLNQRVKDLQSQSEMSLEEALDLISKNAEEILK